MNKRYSFNEIYVSVVIPVYNEERYINNCILSILEQSYPQNAMECIFVDGGSTDRTIEILEGYRARYPHLICVVDNPETIVPCAMNIGIKASKGKYIIRMDAHADYPQDYIEKCLKYLETIEADNVGGVAETKANGFMGKCIAKMLSSKFGVGNSAFRTNDKGGYVDTVPFGAFKRDIFSKYGGYDERLVRNEDNELNYRIRKNGGRIYLANDIHFSYYCRDSVKGISDMAKKNGMWNVITMKLCPGSMGLRHFVPLFFVVSIIALIILGFFYNAFLVLLVSELFFYFVLDFIFSLKQGNTIKEDMTLLLLFPLFHVSYGIGSLIGIIKLFSKKYRNRTYKIPVL